MIVVGLESGDQKEAACSESCAAARRLLLNRLPFARRYLSGTRDHTARIHRSRHRLDGQPHRRGRLSLLSHTRWTVVVRRWSLVALGALGSGIAYVLNFIVWRSDATTAAPSLLTPLVAIIVGALVLGERICLE